MSATKDTETSSATISADTLKNLETTTSAEVEVTANTKMQMDTNVLSAIAGTDATDVKLIAQEMDASELPQSFNTTRVNDTVYNFDLQDAEGNSLFGKNNTTGGKITITVPYQLKEGEDPATITILWLNDDGSTVAVPARYSYDDQNGGMVSFELEHFSYYTVVRMTGEEICACEKKHIEKVTVVPKTCTQAGYTVTICTRCKQTWQTNEQPPLGHSYTQTTVAPTCTERGYTRYVCQNTGCNDSYVADYKPQIAHVYQDKVIAPTCTEKGLTAHTCLHCGKTYRDSYVVPNGHTYRNGNCKDCGERDLTHLVNADNIYFNLIESVINADGFYIEVEDVEMHGSMNSDEMSGEVDYEMDMYRFTFKLDENGYIVGQGEGKMKATMTSTTTTRTEENAPPQTKTETEKFDMEMIVVFQDGKIYMFQKETEQIGEFISKFINSMQTESEEAFSVSKIISDNKDKTMAQVVSEMIGEEVTVEDCQGMIQGVLDMTSEMTLVDFVIMAGMSGGGNQEGGMSSNPQTQPNPEPKPEPMSGELGGEEGNEGNEGEEGETNPLQQQIAGYIALFGEEIDRVYTGDWQAQGEELILKYNDSQDRVDCDGAEVRFGSYDNQNRSYVLTKQA